MRSFLALEPIEVKLAVHIDKNESAHPFKGQLSGVSSYCHYTEALGRPSAVFLVQGVLKPLMSSCDFYLCGPQAFVTDMKFALSAGVANVYVDVFVSSLA